MATYKTSRDIATAEIAGVSLLSDLRSLSIDGVADENDATVITSPGENVNNGQRYYNISYSVNSQTASCPVKVNSSHLTVFTLGGTDYKSVVRSLSLDLAVKNVDTSAAGDTFKSHQALSFNFSGTVEIMVLASAAHAIWTTFKAGSGLGSVWSATLNGTAITVPMVITGVSLVEDGANVTILRVTVKGQAPCTGDYPTAPTTGSDLLTGFLVDPRTPVEFDFLSAAANGEPLNIMTILTSLSFSIANGQIVETSYSLISTGAPL